ncbi:hypothetical protein BDV35DRAFT_365742 [Aspergillus flavus]|uniref:Uncharacterized protein n=1 Tax=Aspergillus flavus TaxID=5059 RepID=A0A5N6GKP9_ASPFL|nr:hypothetical protein BDV35DRAFT_365742 [Aspergillus flavus]
MVKRPSVPRYRSSIIIRAFYLGVWIKVKLTAMWQAISTVDGNRVHRWNEDLEESARSSRDVVGTIFQPHRKAHTHANSVRSMSNASHADG